MQLPKIKLQAVKQVQEKQKQKALSEQQQAGNALQNYVNNPGGELYTYGTPAQQQEMAANLSQVGVQTGQSMFQTGQQQQQGLGMLQDRIGGGDAVATHMMGQRNRNMATMGRSLAGKKVAGSVAGASMLGAQESADKSIASQQQGFGRQNYQDLMKYVGRQQKVEGEATASGKDAGKAAEMSVDAGSGISVICTELHRQGYLSAETLKKDTAVGWGISMSQPYIYIGYYVWAVHFARLMSKSRLFTMAVAFFAVPYASHVAGDKNFLGACVKAVGMPLCKVIGIAHVHNHFRKSADV
jgi:hypothetical protein